MGKVNTTPKHKREARKREEAAAQGNHFAEVARPSPPRINQWVRVHTAEVGALDGVCVFVDEETTTYQVYFPQLENTQTIDSEDILAYGPTLEVPRF